MPPYQASRLAIATSTPKVISRAFSCSSGRYWRIRVSKSTRAALVLMSIAPSSLPFVSDGVALLTGLDDAAAQLVAVGDGLVGVLLQHYPGKVSLELGMRQLGQQHPPHGGMDRRQTGTR